ncbi:hypothetical protein ncot_02320 [Nocardioides sp. JQ2195]|nr:hypothetical protein ncot_02320 [Nocardioides sp. JQ2195]
MGVDTALTNPSPTNPSPTASSVTADAVTLADLLEVLDLERLDAVADADGGPRRWRGQPQAHPDDRTFGGLLLAQGLVAAGRTAATDQRIVSLQADFIGAVPADRPMHWRVDLLSDARSLSTRRSTLLADDGSELFTATTRWATTREDLPSWSSAAPASVPGPETLQDLADRHRDDPRIPAWWRIERPVHFRHVEPPPYLTPSSVTDRQTVHVRATSDLPLDPVIRAAVAAYVTDMSLLEPAYRALGAVRHKPGSRILSLTHGITFHREPDLSTWHQFDTYVGIIAHGRAHGDGELFDSEGRHVLSTTQLGLVKTV